MEFFDALVRYEVSLWAAVDQELGRLELVDLSHLHALRVVDRYSGSARVQDLSNDIGITVGVVSKLVDRLERDGLVARSPNPANRRSSLIALTATGRDALAAALQVARSVVDGAVGAEDAQRLVAALGRLQDRLDRRRVGAAA